MRSTLTAIGLCLAAILPAAAAEVNVYSARHYDTDLALHEAFTRETGITVNLIEGIGPFLAVQLRQAQTASPRVSHKPPVGCASTPPESLQTATLWRQS